MDILGFYNAVGLNDGISEVSSDSQTVPDMSLSVKQILERFRRGTIDLDTLNRVYPNEDDDIDDDTLDGVEDLVDLTELAKSSRHSFNRAMDDIRHSSESPSDEKKEDVSQ